MNEITKGVSYKEYLLTLIRILVFLNYLGKDHKKNTSEDRIVLYDFFLKYPELTNSSEKMDFDTKYSYFHWKPNYKLYATLLVALFSLKCRKAYIRRSFRRDPKNRSS